MKKKVFPPSPLVFVISKYVYIKIIMLYQLIAGLYYAQNVPFSVLEIIRESVLIGRKVGTMNFTRRHSNEWPFFVLYKYGLSKSRTEKYLSATFLTSI